MNRHEIPAAHRPTCVCPGRSEHRAFAYGPVPGRARRLLRIAPVPFLVVIACTVAACASGDDGGPDQVAVASVTVTPQQASVEVGASTTLSATPRDANGSPLSGRTVTWSSQNSSIASVDNGVVTGVSAGNTTVRATSEGRFGEASIEVTSPPVASIDVTPNPAVVFVGGLLQLSAVARAANGTPIDGVQFAWDSDNETIAQVDQSGLVMGVGEGGVEISASAQGVTGSSMVDVSVHPPLVITQVAPATLVEGQPATITGSGFSSVPGENTVLVDGTAANVTQASAVSLDIVVPTFDCRPKRNTAVSVMNGGLMATAPAQPLSPGNLLALGVGDMAVIDGGAQRCLQFDAAAGAERYVFGVQSVSDVPATLTGVTVGSAIPTGAPPAAPLPPAPLAAAPPIAIAAEDLARVERWERHLSSTIEAYERERAILQPIADGAAPRPTPAFASAPTVPGSVSVGEELTIRFPDYGGNTCTSFTNITVTVRKITDKAIFVEDNANPVMLDPSVFDQAGTDFDFIYDAIVDHYGAFSDMDANERVVVVITREVNRVSSPPLAFVSQSNLFPTSQCAASNEGEFYFSRAADPTGQFTAGVYSVAEMTADFTGLLMHEGTHIVQGARRMAVGGQFMASFMAEALATSAQELIGFLFLGLQQGMNYGPSKVYTTFGADSRALHTYMGDLLAYFGFDFSTSHIPGTPEECTWVGTAAAGGNPGPCLFPSRIVYGVPWSLIKHTIDRRLGGPANEKQYLRAFSEFAGGTGFTALEGVLGRSIGSMMADWAPMLYIDDKYPGVVDFQFLNWDIRAIAAAWQTPNSDLLARDRAFATFADNFNLRAGSSAYYDISGSNRPATAIRFRDGSGNALPQFVQIWIVRVQ